MGKRLRSGSALQPLSQSPTRFPLWAMLMSPLTTECARQELTPCAATHQRSSARLWIGRIVQTTSLPPVSQHISRFLTRSMTTGLGALLDIEHSESLHVLPPFRLYI